MVYIHILSDQQKNNRGKVYTVMIWLSKAIFEALDPQQVSVCMHIVVQCSAVLCTNLAMYVRCTTCT